MKHTLLSLLLVLPSLHAADLKLAGIFADHAVLQRDIALPVWGWADPGAAVSVSFAGQNQTAAAGADGKWTVKLTPLKANSKGSDLMVKSGPQEKKITDVVVGEVWMCSGQSNMEWTVASSTNAQNEIKNANNPRIRHFKIPHVTSKTPETEVRTQGGWQATTSQTVGSFTAVGFFFGREIEKALDVPVGLIGCNWGGTRIEPWTPPAGFQSVPALKQTITDKLDTLPAMTPVVDQIPVLGADGKPVLENGRPKMKQQPKLGPDGKPLMEASRGSPMAMFNAMVNPLVPYGIRGALWYQGEANNGEGMMYHEKMKALINGWRAVWQEGDFPFYWVELAPYRYGRPDTLPAIWEAQTATLALPNTGMAVTTDVATVGNIHPPDKQTVGHRLALWALAETYHKPSGIYASPLFDSLKIDGSKAIVSFKNAANGLKSRDGQPLSWFTIAGADKKFVEAKAEIVGSNVVVSAAGVDKPEAVRFGWNELAEPNLSSTDGLPASPFRTDKWTDAVMPVLAPSARGK